MQINSLITNKGVRQFISYFFVGGISAVVEWVMFFLFANVLSMDYMLATCLAFIFSTTTNLILGRLWTFKNNTSYMGKRLKEAVNVFIVSAVGLLLNMVLMYCFVSILGFNDEIGKTVSKIAATGIVFVWNYCIRKYVIYK